MHRLAPNEDLIHILICNNQRDGDELPSCGHQRGTEVARTFRRWIAKNRLYHKVWVTTTDCLGWCHNEGVTLSIYPKGHFYHRVTPEDCQHLIHTYLEPLLPRPLPLTSEHTSSKTTTPSDT